MSNAKRFLEEWFGEDGRPSKKVPESKNTVYHDKYDREDYEAVLNEMKSLSVAEDRLTDAVSTGSSAMADTFFALMKANPKLKDAKDVRPSYLVNYAVMDEAMKLKEYEDLRTSSTSDLVASGLSCAAMEPELEILFDKLKEEQKLADQLEQMLGQMEGMDGELEDAEGMMAAAAAAGKEGEAKDYQEQAEKIKEQMDKLREEMKAKAEEFDGKMDAKIPELKEITKEAMKDAKEKAEELDGLSSTWGLDPGQLSKMPAERRIQLASKFNNERFRRIADLLGPMQRLAMAEQKKKVDYARDEMYDMELGNDLGYVIPTEMLLAGDEIGEMLFFDRYINENLVQYKLRGTEKVAKGGIIVCEDGSGSMSGDPEVWAKAVALSLYQICKLQKRPFSAIHFGGVGEYQQFDFHINDKLKDGVDIELYGKPWRTQENPTGHYETIDGVIKYAETFFGGGTDFVTPLSAALDTLRAQYDKDGAIKGDIVFITDGICGVPDEWLKEFKEEQERLGFRVWGILLGWSPSKDSEPLKTICDGKVFLLSDLIENGGKGITKIFGSV